jgi:hypothetical protein
VFVKFAPQICESVRENCNWYRSEIAINNYEENFMKGPIDEALGTPDAKNFKGALNEESGRYVISKIVQQRNNSVPSTAGKERPKSKPAKPATKFGHHKKLTSKSILPKKLRAINQSRDLPEKTPQKLHLLQLPKAPDNRNPQRANRHPKTDAPDPQETQTPQTPPTHPIQGPNPNQTRPQPRPNPNPKPNHPTADKFPHKNQHWTIFNSHPKLNRLLPWPTYWVQQWGRDYQKRY